MRNVSTFLHCIRERLAILLSLIVDAMRYLGLCLRPSPRLAAENLFLRKQLALYQERQDKPRQATNAIRLAMVWLSRFFDWRSALSIVKPETFTRWHRQGFRWFWRCKSKPGRPALPKDLQALIRRMALDVVKTPVRTPVANSICERVLGTLRRECLDFVIPLNDKHLYGILKEWVGTTTKAALTCHVGQEFHSPCTICLRIGRLNVTG